MNRRTFLLSAAGAAASGPRRPNVLFLLPDQFRAQALGCMGNPDVRTPNLDRLASEGLLLRNTLANTPVCCPARANLLTGKYAHKNGMIANDLRLRESEVTVAEALRQEGYRTGFIGKWHLDGGPRLPGYVPPGPRRQGFEFWAANECSHTHFRTHYFRDSPEPIPIAKFEAEGWADLGIEFLESSRKDARPFFLTIQMGPPHDPYRAPPEYSRLYDPAKLRMRPNWKAVAGMPGPAQIAEYYGMVTAVDHQIGRLVRALDDFGMGEDTLVVVSSDHGDMLGSHGLPLKRKPWEESIRVPGILRYPRRVKPFRESVALFTHVDFAPTLLGLCGARRPAGMQGSDLARVILGRTERGPESAFFQIFGPYQAGRVTEGWRGVRTQKYMYARHQSKPWVLYDLEKDPYELNNLVEDAAAADLLKKMDQRLTAWMKRTGDSWSYNWTAPVEDAGRLYKHQTFHTVDEYLQWARQHPDPASK
ncbi:MAG: sulfatase [Acidobacteria bacterium]|nr:sulfatase [Acidobacteriota bacterium]